MREYTVNEDELHKWRNILSTAHKYPKEQGGTQKILKTVLNEIDSMLLNENYYERW